MKKTLLALAITSTISATAFAAPGDAVPNTFSNGTPADADQVNANFAEVVDQISTLVTSGIPGNDGVGISTVTDNDDGTFTITLTDSSSTIISLPSGPVGQDGANGINGSDGANGTNGINGTDGTNGIDGVGISSITDNNDGTFTIALTNGSSSIITMPAGPAGSDGTNGTNGADGTNGIDGVGISSTTNNNDGTFTIALTDGSSSIITMPVGPAGSDGINGPSGTNGTNGTDGIGIASITDDGAGTLTITLTDTSETTHSIPIAATVYSYRNFGTTFGEKVFDVVDSRNKFISEIQTFTRSPGIVSHTRNRIKPNGIDTWKYATITLDNSGDELLLVEKKDHPVNAGTPDPSTATYTETLSPGHIARTTTMEKGGVFGSDVAISYDDGVNPVRTTFSIQTGALIAVNQTVTVPAGTFTGCIKTSTNRSGINSGGSLQRINTFCPGAGLVKQIQTKKFYNDNNDGLGSTTQSSVITHTFMKELSSCKNESLVAVPNCGGTP